MDYNWAIGKLDLKAQTYLMFFYWRGLSKTVSDR